MYSSIAVDRDQVSTFKPLFPSHLILTQKAAIQLEIASSHAEGVSAHWYCNGESAIQTTALSYMLDGRQTTPGFCRVNLHRSSILLQTYSLTLGK